MFWSVSRGSVRIVVETPPQSERAMRLVRSSLELEGWLRGASFVETLDGTRWTIVVEREKLGSPEARKWIARHTELRERRPEILRWLEEWGR